MYLRKIILSNFKNIAQAELEFSDKFNSILGDNGEGKTNLLDAIYYLSVTKSYFSHSDRYVIRCGEEKAALNGLFSLDGDTEEIAIGVDSKGVKQLKRNKKMYHRISEYIGLIPVVMVSPYDSELVNDSGEMRRRFMNLILFQIDREYLSKLQSYNRLIVQRNSLLRSDLPSDDLLMTFAEQLSSLGQSIYESRKRLCESFAEPLAEYYSVISGRKETVDLEYGSQLSGDTLLKLMESSLGRDKELRYTTCGIQRDDMVFQMDGSSIRRYGSQGQQKSFLIALKLAEFSIMKEHYGFSPILLLDDLFDRLDSHRVGKLISLVASDRFGQIFLTDSNPERISSIIRDSGAGKAAYSVKSGQFERIE
ncbi:MAG: DNA replication and repair protein RecF [Bacteroidales bacterium]|nr:DNA replication and repair protein RecF [Bacteroidales bacterium]MCI2121616.1 DNA replication and repair protein RecF [Bacteroidales bacterium]MCI2144705.1 DNA replication and repair protein RecF [Bacteroidales bacterium]